jgi:hypothetical protein
VFQFSFSPAETFEEPDEVAPRDWRPRDGWYIDPRCTVREVIKLVVHKVFDLKVGANCDGECRGTTQRVIRRQRPQLCRSFEEPPVELDFGSRKLRLLQVTHR